MVDRICSIESKFIELAEMELASRPIERIDIREMGEIADIIKDLSEAAEKLRKAEYYRSVVSAMGQKAEEAKPAWQYSDHSDSLDPLRKALQAAGPDEREQLRTEVKMMIGAM